MFWSGSVRVWSGGLGRNDFEHTRLPSLPELACPDSSSFLELSDHQAQLALAGDAQELKGFTKVKGFLVFHLVRANELQELLGLL